MKPTAAPVLLLFALLLPGPACQPTDAVVIGSKAFTEGYIVSTLASLAIEAAGIPVRERFGVGSMIARQALLGGQIDLYPEYTGTAHTLFHRSTERITEPQRLYATVRETDRDQGVVWLERSGIDNTYALALRKADAARIGTTLSQLARFVRRHPSALRFGVDHEFYRRPDGFQAMLAYYDIPLPDDRIATMDIGLSFESIERGQIDVAMVYSTDGKLIQYELVVLEDDRRFFPVYELCFNLRAATLARRPELRPLLNAVTDRLDTATMQRLNYEVDGRGKPVRMVAEEFLAGAGAPPAD